MPLTNREALQLGLLLLCVPLQYLLSSHFSTTVTERSQLGYKLAVDFQQMQEYFNVDIRGTYHRIIGYVLTGYASFVKSRRLMAKYGMHDDPSADPPESPALEVLQYRQRLRVMEEEAGTGAAEGQAVRSRRPPGLRFRVGQVVAHKTHGYRAVVVGWDLGGEEMGETGEAALQGVGFEPQIQLVQSTPHYTLLVDQRDAAALSKSGLRNPQTYVVQSQLELVKNTKIQHPELATYFLYFDGGQYIPKDALRKIYPKD